MNLTTLGIAMELNKFKSFSATTKHVPPNMRSIDLVEKFINKQATLPYEKVKVALDGKDGNVIFYFKAGPWEKNNLGSLKFNGDGFYEISINNNKYIERSAEKTADKLQQQLAIAMTEYKNSKQQARNHV